MSRGPVGFVRDGISDVRLVSRGWRWGVGRRAPVPRSAEPYVPPRSTRVFPTGWARTRVVNALRDLLLGVGMHWLLRSQVSVRTHGRDVLRRIHGPVVVASNHSSHIDTPLILTTLPMARRRRTAVAAAADYFFDTWWRAAGSAVLFNTFPIERRGGALSTTPTDLLRDGWSVVVFPEGTRTTDGTTRTFKAGAAFMALDAQVPVVPVAIRGAFNAMPRGQGWPSRGRPRVVVRYGDPVVPEPDESPRDLNRRIEGAVRELLDEDATSWYAARRRAAVGGTGTGAGTGAGALAPTDRADGRSVARWRRVWDASREPASTAQPGRRERIWR